MYLCAVVILFKRNYKQIVFFSIILFFIGLISFVNTNMMNATGEVFSWDMISMLKEASKVLARNFLSYQEMALVYLVIISLAIYALIKIGKKKIIMDNFKGFQVRFGCSLLLLITAFSFCNMQFSKMELNGSDDPINDTTFMSYITTFAMHGPYSYRAEFESYYDKIDEYMVKNNATFFPSLNGNDIDLTNQQIRTYLAACMDLDIGIGVLMDKLNNENLLDKISIIMLSDHYAYYDDLAIKTKKVTDENDPKLYNVPAVIYDNKVVAKMKSENPKYLNSILICDKFITNMDFVPTILNIQGISYNERWYLGFDIFSNKQSFEFSRWGGLYNNLYYSIDGRNILNFNPNYYIEGALSNTEKKQYDDIQDVFRIQTKDFIERVTIIDMIYQTNYFNLKRY